LTTAGHHMRM